MSESGDSIDRARGHLTGRRQREAPGPVSKSVPQIALLTGGGDKPYAIGLATALISEGISFDFIGSTDLQTPELLNNSRVNFLNLRGDQSPQAHPLRKALRVLAYYLRLIKYAATSEAKIFHILWHNKFEIFDQTVLLLYYKCLGKRIVFTAHNVNARQRDGNDNWLNRLSLRVQYRLVDHIFVHTEKMKVQLRDEFGVPETRASVIPFGINNTVPNTALRADEAKQRLGLSKTDRVLLFFGSITPYKGLEYLIGALEELTQKSNDYRLVIAGKPKEGPGYWKSIQETITRKGLTQRVMARSENIPDEEVELYFKAADVLILPYTQIFQSGVLFLGYNFGLPAIAADVGSLREEIIEGKTGFVFRAKDPVDLAKTIDAYFSSELYGDLERRRPEIRDYANERYSWSKVAVLTTSIYSQLLQS